MSLMGQMRNFTIRTRMVGAIGVVLILLLLVGGTGIHGMLRTQDALHDFRHHSYQELVDLSRLKQDIGDLRRHEAAMLLGAGQPQAVDAAQARWQQALEGMRRACLAMLASWIPNDTWAVHVNAGHAHRPLAGENARQAAVAVTWQPDPRWLLFAEVTADQHEDVGRAAGVRWWLIPDTLGLDATVQKAHRSGTGTGWGVGLGWYGLRW